MAAGCYLKEPKGSLLMPGAALQVRRRSSSSIEMSPVTHFLTCWLAANVGQLENKDRIIVTMSAVIPDVDGLRILAGIISNDR